MRRVRLSFFSGAMATNPKRFIWRGPIALQQQQPKWSFSPTGVTAVVAWEGPYNDCLEKKPVIGASVSGFSGFRLRVMSVDVDPIASDAGRMTVTMRAPIGVNRFISNEPIGDPVYELQAGEAGQAIERHPRCGYLLPDRSLAPSRFGRIKTWDDWADLTIYDYFQPTGYHWTLADYLFLKSRGVDSFTQSIPVVRRTLQYFRGPSNLGQGLHQLQLPPIDAPLPALPPAMWGGQWYWVLNSDELSVEGRSYRRTTQWTAMIFADAVVSQLLYLDI